MQTQIENCETIPEHHYCYLIDEGNRVPLQYVDEVENSDYINAVFVHVCIFHRFFQLVGVGSNYLQLSKY